MTLTPDPVPSATRSIVDGLLREAKLVPFTVFTVIAILAVLSLYVVPAVGKIEPLASTVATVAGRLGSMELRIRRDVLRSRLASYDSEMFQLEREQARLAANSQQMPDVLFERLHRLRSERDLALKELEVVLRTPPDDATEP